MHIEIDATPYKLCLHYTSSLQSGATVVRFPDGIEASCNELQGLWMILEVLGGRQWWQHHHPQVIQQVLTMGVGES